MTSTSQRGLVVLLHGQPGAGVEWHRVVQALGDSVEALAPDRPGYGASELPPAGVGEHVEWLIQLVEDHAGGRPAIVVGHSWAGSVALAMALERPDLTRALALVSSVGPGAITRMDRVLARPVVGAIASRPVFGVAGALLGPFVARTAPDEEIRARTLDTVRASRTRGVWRTFLVEQMALVHEAPAVFDQLDHVATTTHVVAGTRDRVVPFATAEALARALPAAELVTVRGGGHRLHRTHPGLIAGVIHRLLAETDGS